MLKDFKSDAADATIGSPCFAITTELIISILPRIILVAMFNAFWIGLNHFKRSTGKNEVLVGSSVVGPDGT
jgi:hypothetical protein